MTKPIALRSETELLKEVRRCASEENRSLTNFIETVLKNRVAAGPPALSRPPAGEPKTEKRRKDMRR